ncbi:MAG TPA: helix-turn-helix transcriptional regulator [Opitutales bacterium]|nr:helix-turn-helix transcriptional regulator [Opitutales bacterium]
MTGFSLILTVLSISFYSDLQLMHGATGLHPDRPIILDDRDYYCLQYNRNGTIIVQMDTEAPQEVVGPSLLITSPGHRFLFGNDEGWNHNFIAFRGERVKDYIRSGLLPVVPALRRLTSANDFSDLFECCVRALRDGDHLQASHLFEGLLVRLHKPSEESKPLAHYEAVRELAATMRDAPDEHYDLEQCASGMHISEAHLRRLFRSLIGSPPKKFLLQCRLNAASEWLAASRMPIKQIASHYQFESVHHFSRVFKNHCGVPPGRFRREALGR